MLQYVQYCMLQSLTEDTAEGQLLSYFLTQTHSCNNLRVREIKLMCTYDNTFRVLLFYT